MAIKSVLRNGGKRLNLCSGNSPIGRFAVERDLDDLLDEKLGAQTDQGRGEPHRRFW